VECTGRCGIDFRQHAGTRRTSRWCRTVGSRLTSWKKPVAAISKCPPHAPGVQCFASGCQPPPCMVRAWLRLRMPPSGMGACASWTGGPSQSAYSTPAGCPPCHTRMTDHVPPGDEPHEGPGALYTPPHRQRHLSTALGTYYVSTVLSILRTPVSRSVNTSVLPSIWEPGDTCVCIYTYCFAIVHLGAFCIENAPTLVATKSCPVTTGAHSGCNLFTSGSN
jgi:hypothetical protein